MDSRWIVKYESRSLKTGEAGKTRDNEVRMKGKNAATKNT